MTKCGKLSKTTNSRISKFIHCFLDDKKDDKKNATKAQINNYLLMKQCCIPLFMFIQICSVCNFEKKN